ncbi:MAG TPA: transporter substrate-binding domain-containing protein, partial [Anaerolineae bacterium]
MIWKRLLVILMPMLLAVGSTQTATTNDKLLFLGNSNLPPMLYVQNDQATGLVVDIAHQLAQKVNLSIEVRAMDWTQAQEMVLNGNADALLQINRSPERETLYDFSDPLLESYFTIFRTSSRVDIRDMASLNSKLV